MPTSGLSLSAAATWALQAQGGYFGTNRVPNSTQGWNATTPSLALWTQVFNAVYTIFLGPPGTLASSLVSGGALISGHTYYYKVTGTGPSGQNGTGTAESAASNETSQTVSGANLSVGLTWNALQGATSYNVYRGQSAGSENLLVGTAPASAGAATYAFTDVGYAGIVQSPPVSGPNDYVEFDLYAFTNSIGEATSGSIGHAFFLFVVPTGGGALCTLAPGQANPLDWFFGGTGPTHNVPVNGVFLHAEDPAGPGAVLTTGARTLRITNGGSGTLTVAVIAGLGP